jgi:hypothetical protein
MKRELSETCRECKAEPGHACVTRLGVPLWAPCYTYVLTHEQPVEPGSAEVPREFRALNSGALR